MQWQRQELLGQLLDCCGAATLWHAARLDDPGNRLSVWPMTLTDMLGVVWLAVVL